MWYNYNAINKEAGCFSAGKGIETMKRAFITKYRIMIKSASVKHVLSDDWDKWDDAMDYLDLITDDRGYYVDENAFEWDCYVESYYARR